MQWFLENTQDYNPLTWDIQLNPAAWWLSLKDINSAASVELKSSLYSGNLNLTADQYREVQSLVADKYSAIDVSGIIAPGAITKNWEIAGGIDMTWKDSGLYMSNDRLWFYDGTAWQVWIGNNGDFFFGWDASNYIEWSGSTLTVRWDIEVADGSITAPKLAASLVYAWEIVIDTSGEIRSGQSAYDTGTWFWLWDVGGTKKFSIGNSAGNKLTFDGTNLAITWAITASSWAIGWFSIGSSSLAVTSGANTTTISSWTTAFSAGPTASPTITITQAWVLTSIGGTITGWIVQTGLTGKRIVLESDTFKAYNSSNVLRLQSNGAWFRFTDSSNTYNTDIEWWQYTTLPALKVAGAVRADVLAANSWTSLNIYLHQWELWFRDSSSSLSWIRLTSPNDDTLVLHWTTMTLNWKNLYSDGTDLFWNWVKIN